MDNGKKEESEDEDVIDMNDNEKTIMKEYFVQEAGQPDPPSLTHLSKSLLN